MNFKDNVLYAIGIFVMICLYSFKVEEQRNINANYKYKIDSIKTEQEQIELKYKKLVDTISTSSDFIQKVYTIYKPLQKEAGILPSFLIATAILESNHGESRLTVESNNLFCIKGSYNNKCVYFKDDEVGLSKFRKYDSYEESINDYINLMNSARYCDILGQRDYKFCANFVKKKGYASNPHYSSKIIEIIEKYQLHLLDLI